MTDFVLSVLANALGGLLATLTLALLAWLWNKAIKQKPRQ
jgi:cell division protein FtsW (lipid II flippase)